MFSAVYIVELLPDLKKQLNDRIHNGTFSVGWRLSELCENFRKKQELKGIKISIGPVNKEEDGYDAIGVTEVEIDSINSENPEQHKKTSRIVEVNPDEAYAINLDDNDCPSKLAELQEIYRELKGTYTKREMIGGKIVVDAIVEAVRSKAITARDAEEQMQVFAGILSGEISADDPKNKMQISFDLRGIKEAKWSEAGLSRLTISERKKGIEAMAHRLIKLGVVDKDSVNFPETAKEILIKYLNRIFSMQQKETPQLPPAEKIQEQPQDRAQAFRKREALGDGTYRYTSPKQLGLGEDAWRTNTNPHHTDGEYRYTSASKCGAPAESWKYYIDDDKEM